MKGRTTAGLRRKENRREGRGRGRQRKRKPRREPECASCQLAAPTACFRPICALMDQQKAKVLPPPSPPAPKKSNKRHAHQCPLPSFPPAEPASWLLVDVELLVFPHPISLESAPLNPLQRRSGRGSFSLFCARDWKGRRGDAARQARRGIMRDGLTTCETALGKWHH